MLCQQGENLKRLLLQFDSNAAFAQLTGPQVNLKNAETAGLFATFSGRHRTPPLALRSSVARVLRGFNTHLPTSSGASGSRGVGGNSTPTAGEGRPASPRQHGAQPFDRAFRQCKILRMSWISQCLTSVDT